MDFDISEIIESYFNEKDTFFSKEEFSSYMKTNGVKLSKKQVEDILHSSDRVFCFDNNQYLTRAGLFKNKYFSFKPSMEEIKSGRFFIGHRCMPFANGEIGPDSITVISGTKKLKSKPCVFSMNLAIDNFSLFGDGYVIPYIVSDKGNKNLTLSSIQNSMPTKISLTSWAFSDLKGGKNIKYGDRVICRVVNWEQCVIDMYVEHDNSPLLTVTEADIARENWCLDFENGMLECFDKYGPATSIEEQLLYLYLERSNSLCVKNCSSIDEVLEQSSRICFEPYGVESRIWKKGNVVPLVGNWNKDFGKQQIIIDLTIIFTPLVMDAFIKNGLYRESVKNEQADDILDDLLDSVVPRILFISLEDRNNILLNIKKRRDILKQSYNPSLDYKIADIRERTLTLFSKVCSLLCSVGCSRGEIEELPQQELVILSQLYGHLIRLLEEFGSEYNFIRVPMDDVSVSLAGMEETYGEIGSILEAAITADALKGFEIISDDS